MGACMRTKYIKEQTKEENDIAVKGAFITEYFSQMTLNMKKCNHSLFANEKK
jgi:hypothetical protein